MTDAPTSQTTGRIMPLRLLYGASGRMMMSGIAAYPHALARSLAPGERCLGAFIVPPFQRGLVWTVQQKVKLIESLYMGLPVGSIVWNQTRTGGPCDAWLLDGQQRVTAIVGWLSGDFAVSGWRYPDLPEIERRHFDRIGIENIQTEIEDEATCREVYDRLVYGGTAHEPKEASHV